MLSLLFFLFLGSGAQANEVTSASLQEAICPVSEEKVEALFPTPEDPYGHAKPAALSFAERENRLGPCKKVEPQGENRFLILYEGARLPLQVLSAGEGEPQALRFGRPLFAGDTLDRVWADLRATAPASSILVQKNGKNIFARREDESLSVDLSFGLVLLDAVRSLKLGRDTVLPLAGVERLPWSGLLGQWPEGSLITVDTALALLFVHRDRTAFDLLASRLGPDSLSEAWGSPVWLQADFARFHGLKKNQRKILSKLSGANWRSTLRAYEPTPEQLPNTPQAGAGWQASTSELCRLLLAHRREPILKRTTLLANLPDWNSAAAEGWGPGVAQLTYGIQRPGEKDWYCVSVTANFRGPVKEDRVLEAMERITALLK